MISCVLSACFLLTLTPHSNHYHVNANNFTSACANCVPVGTSNTIINSARCAISIFHARTFFVVVMFSIRRAVSFIRMKHRFVIVMTSTCLDKLCTFRKRMHASINAHKRTQRHTHIRTHTHERARLCAHNLQYSSQNSTLLRVHVSR